MAKVGSQSVANALTYAGFKAKHMHYVMKNSDGEFPSYGDDVVPYILKGGKRNGYMVVSLVREPVARNISALFQSIGKLYPPGSRRPYDDLFKGLVETIPYDHGDRWFENEFKALFKFDLLKQPFDTEKGYEIYEHKPHRTLMIRLEDANRVFSAATEEFLGVPVEMRHDNPVHIRFKRKKFYADMYERMTTEPLPEEYLDRVYSQKYARHYYTPEELASFKERWLKGK